MSLTGKEKLHAKDDNNTKGRAYKTHTEFLALHDLLHVLGEPLLRDGIFEVLPVVGGHRSNLGVASNKSCSIGRAPWIGKDSSAPETNEGIGSFVGDTEFKGTAVDGTFAATAIDFETDGFTGQGRYETGRP
ncbi:hypothetical protein HG530_008672 [Fusarium avenaceum]|nr:hypothetical protein HG530_008672 [Fusarium avenaceum]